MSPPDMHLTLGLSPMVEGTGHLRQEGLPGGSGALRKVSGPLSTGQSPVHR